MRSRAAQVLLLAWLLGAGDCRAHQAGESYLALRPRVGYLEAQLDLPLRDLELLLGLDADADGALTWGELRAREVEVAALAGRSLELRQGGRGRPPEVGELAVVRRDVGLMASLPLRFEGLEPGPASLGYRFLAGVDPMHRCLVEVEGRSGTLVMEPGGHPLELELSAATEEAAPGWELTALGIGLALTLGAGIARLRSS